MSTEPDEQATEIATQIAGTFVRSFNLPPEDKRRGESLAHALVGKETTDLILASHRQIGRPTLAECAAFRREWSLRTIDELREWLARLDRVFVARLILYVCEDAHGWSAPGSQRDPRGRYVQEILWRDRHLFDQVSEPTAIALSESFERDFATDPMLVFAFDEWRRGGRMLPGFTDEERAIFDALIASGRRPGSVERFWYLCREAREDKPDDLPRWLRKHGVPRMNGCPKSIPQHERDADFTRMTEIFRHGRGSLRSFFAERS